MNYVEDMNGTEELQLPDCSSSVFLGPTFVPGPSAWSFLPPCMPSSVATFMDHHCPSCVRGYANLICHLAILQSSTVFLLWGLSHRLHYHHLSPSLKGKLLKHSDEFSWQIVRIASLLQLHLKNYDVCQTGPVRFGHYFSWPVEWLKYLAFNHTTWLHCPNKCLWVWMASKLGNQRITEHKRLGETSRDPTTYHLFSCEWSFLGCSWNIDSHSMHTVFPGIVGQ